MLDLTTGCCIEFTEGVFGGSYRNPKFLGERTITGTIVKESYGVDRGQHTFTIEIEKAEGHAADKVLSQGKIRRKGRNVYKACKLLARPDDYEELREDKHERGDAARQQRAHRI
jgi:hypothetical protein